MDLSQIKARAKALSTYTRDAYRALHSMPEIGFSLEKTQAFVCERLDALGIPYTKERTWVIGEIQGGPGKTVALRADMDALPIEEDTGLPFSSAHAGCMHACGHDAHMAILLGTAALLMEVRESLKGTVRLLFQPAEETVGGAVPMIEAGAMDGVDAVYGLHVAATAPVGRIACRPGAMYAACDEVFIDIHGRKGHGAHPPSGVDAVMIAAQVITALQTLVSRELEATDAAVLSIGEIHGGFALNILCDHVALRGTLRTLYPPVRQKMKRRVAELCEGIAASMGGGATVRLESGFEAVTNDEKEAGRVLAMAERLLGAEMTYTLRNSSLGSEDFGYYLQKAPGAIYHLGSGGEHPLHNSRFQIDESCLSVGVMMQASLAIEYLEEETV